MPDRPWKILLIGSNEGETARIKRALLSGLGGEGIILAGTIDDARGDNVRDEVPDVLFVDLDALGSAGIAAVAALRRQAPAVPLIAIGRNGTETQAIEALQAGAQDCLGAAETEGIPLIRAVRYAIERSRFQARLEDARDQDSRDREIGGLSALSGPPPLPVTERSLGSTSLTHRAPDEFDELVRSYGELLDRVLLGRSAREAAALVDAVNSIADRLGMLGAGPRDAVDLHKAAITARLEGRSARKNKAYVEEGRLLLVQLMGHLVSFYRSLSWGPAIRPREARPDAVPAPAASGKKVK
jgi:DNA-binding NarL/FixJ family response regulator